MAALGQHALYSLVGVVRPVMHPEAVALAAVEPARRHESVYEFCRVPFPTQRPGDSIVAEAADIARNRKLGGEMPQQLQQSCGGISRQRKPGRKIVHFGMARCPAFHGWSWVEVSAD